MPVIITFDRCDDRGDIIFIYYYNYGSFQRLGNFSLFIFVVSVFRLAYQLYTE